MESQLQGLITQIKEEGVLEAKKESEKIVEEAKKQAGDKLLRLKNLLKRQLQARKQKLKSFKKALRPQ